MKTIPVVLLIVLSAAAGVAAPADAPPGNWNRVRQLPAGSALELRMISGDVVRAEFSRLLEDALEVMDGGQPRLFPKAQVAEIRVSEKVSRGRNAAVWGLIGFASGFGGACAVWGIGTKGHDTIPSDFIEIGSIAGAIAGGTGALLGATRSTARETVVYRAPRKLAAARSPAG